MNRFKTIIAAGVAVLFCCQFLVAQKSTSYLVSADTVYTMNGKAISPGQVLVVDGKIKSVGKKAKLGGVKVTKIELGKGSVLMPGLVDPYSQTGLGQGGTDEITDEVTPDFKTIYSVDWDKTGLKRQLHAGTTTMCVCPGRQNVFGGISSIIKTADVGIPVINDDGPLVASMCSDPTSRNSSRRRPDSLYVRQPTNRMGVVWILRKTFDKVNRAGDDNPVYPEVQQVLEGNRPFMVYSRMSFDIQTVARLQDEFGFSPIVVGATEAYKVKDMLAKRKYPVILEPIDPNSTSGREGAELCWNQAGVLAEKGITFALSGDNLLEQARFVHRNGLEKEKALEAITTTPAKLLGVDDQVGMIKAGYDADLIALSGDPLEFTSAVQWVMVNGKIVGKTETKDTDKTKEANNSGKAAEKKKGKKRA